MTQAYASRAKITANIFVSFAEASTEVEVAGTRGFEPLTVGFGIRCSNQLSYAPAEKYFSKTHEYFLFVSFIEEANIIRLYLLHCRQGIEPATPGFGTQCSTN